MTCAELEILLCDYVDGTLAAEQMTALDQHVATCRACAELAADVAGATAFFEAVPSVEPPRELLTRILDQIPAERPWWRRMWSGWVEGVLQPRFALGMAMTILSVSMFAKLAGVTVHDVRSAGLNPVKIWQTLDDGTYRLWDRTVKYCDNAPLVSDLESRWSDLNEPGQNGDAGR